MQFLMLVACQIKRDFSFKIFLYVENRNTIGSLSRPKKNDMLNQLLSEIDSHSKIIKILRKKITKVIFISQYKSY